MTLYSYNELVEKFRLRKKEGIGLHRTVARTWFTDTSIFLFFLSILNKYEGWNFNSGKYLFTTDTK